MHYIDLKYINLLSGQLSHFKKKSPTLFNCRCPICGDSKTNKYKTRGYIYYKKGSFFYICHNCGYGTTFKKLLETLNSTLHTQYVMETWVDKSKPEIIVEEPKVEYSSKLVTINLPSIKELSEMCTHFSVDYVKYRQIPKQYWDDLYFTCDFKMFVDEIYPEHGKELIEKDERLIIPFRNEHGRLLGFQGRSLDLSSKKSRYITIKMSDEFKIFGLDRLDKTNQINVLEGPIDSFFIPNSIATCDSFLQGAATLFPKEQLVLIYDCQPRNRDIVRTIQKSIVGGFNVCLLPKDLGGKDINEIIMTGKLTSDDLQSIIKDNTFYGLNAELEFMQWKEV